MIEAGSQPGGSGARGRLGGLDNLTRANAARASRNAARLAVDQRPDRLQIGLLPLPGLDVRVAHLVSFVAVLTAEITCLCHGRFRVLREPRCSTGATAPQQCGLAPSRNRR